MLPTHSSTHHRTPPLRRDAGTIYRGALILPGLVAGLLLWVSVQFPRSTWDHAWLLAVTLVILDGLAALAVRRWPHRLTTIIPSTVVADGLVGWGIAWAYSQSPHTMAPVLLTMFTQEILTYYPTRRGAMGAGIYIVVTNSLLGVVPGIHAAPLWPWSVVLYWTVVDALILGALLLPLRRPRRLAVLTALTAREQEVYDLLIAGWSRAQMAEALHIDAATVRSHMAHIHHKLGDLPR